MGVLVFFGLKKPTPERGISPGAEDEIDDFMKTKSKAIGTISAKVTRANGKIEDLGVIATAYKEND